MKTDRNEELPAPEKQKAENESGGKSYGWIAAVLLAAIIVVGLAYGYTAITEKNRLTKLCNDVASSPDLKYPTTCVPLTKDSSGGDYVDTRSDPMCRCSVDAGNGTVTVIDIRVAKEDTRQ